MQAASRQETSFALNGDQLCLLGAINTVTTDKIFSGEDDRQGVKLKRINIILKAYVIAIEFGRKI